MKPIDQDILYISDMDGTLLLPDKRIGEYTRETLNLLMDKGLCFSIATARSIATVYEMIEDMRISAPIVLLNGVCIYDLKKQSYLDACYFEPDTAGAILNLIEKLRKNVFVFTLPRFAADEQGGNQLVVYYHDLYCPSHAAFYEERKPFCQFKKFVCAKRYHDLPQDKVIYFSTNGPKEEMVELQEEIQRIPGVTTVLYVDRYDESVYFLEWFSKNGSKKNGRPKVGGDDRSQGNRLFWRQHQ